MGDHPTELELELLRTGEAGVPIAQHVAGCAECRGLLARIEQNAAALATPIAAIEIPAARDQAIRSLAQQRARQVVAQIERRRRPRWLRPLYVAAPLAAAASIVFFVTLQRSPQMAPPPAAISAPASADINRDGKVDIVDALQLARAIKSQQARDLRWDQNGDGRVDQVDIDRIAQAAVSLQRRHP